MRGSKARDIRKGVEQIFKLDPTQAIYGDWKPPHYANIEGFGSIKVAKGTPCKLIKTCGRYKYKELKKMYR